MTGRQRLPGGHFTAVAKASFFQAKASFTLTFLQHIPKMSDILLPALN